MQFTLATLLALGSLVAAGPIASPFAQENELERRTGSVPWQTAHMVFHGGPASYNLDVPADGVVYPTSASPYLSSHSPSDGVFVTFSTFFQLRSGC